MGRLYSASFDAVAVSAVQDLFEVSAPADAVVVVHSVWVGQTSDAGDAQAEMLRVTIERAATSGSLGTTPTARPLEVGDPAFGGVVEANNTTRAGTLTLLQSLPFNVQAGLFYQPTPEERIVISPSGILVVGLPAAPADSLTMSGTIIFEEVGG